MVHKNSNKHKKMYKIGDIGSLELLPYGPYWYMFSNFCIFTVFKMSHKPMLMIPTLNIVICMFILAILVATLDFQKCKKENIQSCTCTCLNCTLCNEKLPYFLFHFAIRHWEGWVVAWLEDVWNINTTKC